MTKDELENIILSNGFEQAQYGADLNVWNYPEAMSPLIDNRFRVYCALFLNKENCLEDCTEIYDFKNNVFVLKKFLYVCPIKKDLQLLNEEKLMNVINSQKEMYNKMMKIVKQIMVDEKLNDLEKDFYNGKT